MAEYAAQNCPDCLLGALGCDTPQLVKENRLRLRRFAEEGCLLHNVGILPFNHLVRRIGRSWLEEEKEMYECHVLAGRELLDRSERSEEHTSELQSQSVISYAVFCLKKIFFNDTATTEIYTICYTLSLHDALPIYLPVSSESLSPVPHTWRIYPSFPAHKIGRAHV